MIVLLDNGHGKETAGKRSPDGSLLEWEWTRQMANLVQTILLRRGIDCRLLVPEDKDISLSTRVTRANRLCTQYGAANVCLVSIHVNAAGNGKQWLNARGWSAYTSKGQTRGDLLADCLYDAAEREFTEFKIRKDLTDGDRDWEENFTILSKTRCSAVLVEHFFMDNRDDVKFLLSDDGRMRCALVLINGIIDYINKQKQ